MYKCVVCGKEFESGAVIIPPNVYCQECGEKIDEILDEYEIAYWEAKLKGAAVPDLERHIKAHEQEIAKLKLPPRWFKITILRRLMTTPPR